MRNHGNLLDRVTQRWVVTTRRRIDLSIERWLDGPVGRATAIDTSWLSDEATRLGGQLSTASDQGLLPSMAVLDRPGFRVADLHPDVVDFYEHTHQLRMWHVKALQLHYRLTRELDVSGGSSTPCHRSARVP